MLKVYFVSSPQSIPIVSPLSCLTVGNNIIIFPDFICGLLKCAIQKFTLKYTSDKTAKCRIGTNGLCLPTYPEINSGLPVDSNVSQRILFANMPKI